MMQKGYHDFVIITVAALNSMHTPESMQRYQAALIILY